MGEIKVLFSSINVARSPQVVKSMQWLGDFARGAGFDGVEYMPMLDKFPGHTPRAVGRAAAEGVIDLHSLHATFRETAKSPNTQRMPEEPLANGLQARVISSPLGRLLLPEARDSALVLADIQEYAGRKMPATLYPLASRRRDINQIADANASMHLFQPREQTVRLVGARNIEEFDESMANDRGYRYALDTFHVRRQYGDSPGVVSHTPRSIPVLAPHTAGIHVSLNRVDIPREDHIPTKAEGLGALEGKYAGELGWMLSTAKQLGQVEYAVIETEFGAMRDLTGHSSVDDIQKDYADIVQGFREYWATA